MKQNFDKALAAVLKSEGGFVNNIHDPGGMTNLGVTKATWQMWIGRESNEKEMRALTPELVTPLYKQKYWDKVCGDSLPTGVDYAVFDAAVNSGPGRAAKWLQECVGTTPDGAIGPKTLEAVKAYKGDLQTDYCKKRQAFLESLSTFPVFGKGWTKRVNDVQSTRFHP